MFYCREEFLSLQCQAVRCVLDAVIATGEKVCNERLVSSTGSLPVSNVARLKGLEACESMSC